ncbi:16108_t:CDS:1, partial [Cetraspora pellucida]
MSSLIPKRPKLLDIRVRKKNFNLSSKQEKTPIIEAKAASMSYSSNSKPNKSNNQNNKSWA